MPAPEQRGQVWAECAAGGARQRGEIDDEVRLFFARTRQRIAQNKPPLGVGIADFDGYACARAQHVAGAEGIARNRIFHCRHQQMQAHFQPACHD